MLEAHFHLRTAQGPQHRSLRIWNVSCLARVSCYEFDAGTRGGKGLRLQDYPRWCESTRALAARCLALTTAVEDDPLPADWLSAQIDIGLRPGGSGALKGLAMAQVTRQPGGLEVGFAEKVAPVVGHVANLPGRASFVDAWSLAEYALRVSCFGSDSLPEVRPLDVPIRESQGLRYIRTSDIPEPTGSIFRSRMAHSTRPLIAEAPDAFYAWDWQHFLGGAR